MESNFSEICKQRWIEEADENEKLLQPLLYILELPGNNLRLKLVKAFNYWLNIPQDKQETIEDIIHILHKSSLLLDDIQDNSSMRRGKPAAQVIYGNAWTINAATYAACIAMDKTIKLGHPDACRLFTKHLKEMHKGQGMGLYWRENFICPTEEEYLKMTTQKTGGLFVLSLDLMQLFSENKSDFTKLVSLLGPYFQIIDDYVNLYKKEYMKSKGFCDDIQEGKFSFPIIHAIRENPDDNRILNILKQRPRDDKLKQYCVNLLEHYGSLEYCRNRLLELQDDISNEIRKLGGNDCMEELVPEFYRKIL